MSKPQLEKIIDDLRELFDNKSKEVNFDSYCGHKPPLTAKRNWKKGDILKNLSVEKMYMPPDYIFQLEEDECCKHNDYFVNYKGLNHWSGRFELVRKAEDIIDAQACTTPSNFLPGDKVKWNPEYKLYHKMDYNTIYTVEKERKSGIHWLVDVKEIFGGMYSCQFELVERPFTPKFKKGDKFILETEKNNSGCMVYTCSGDSYLHTSWSNKECKEAAPTRNYGLFYISDIIKVTLNMEG